MGRKTDRIAALEHELAQADAEAMRQDRRLADARNVITSMVDALSGERPYDVDALIGQAESWLDFDPRPPSDHGKLHWLHVKDGDRLVWRLAAELVALHDLEAERLGEPTWRGFGARVRPCGDIEESQ